MGLCLGFSGLSAIEILYFLTMRAYFRRRMAEKAEAQGRIHHTSNSVDKAKDNETQEKSLAVLLSRESRARLML